MATKYIYIRNRNNVNTRWNQQQQQQQQQDKETQNWYDSVDEISTFAWIALNFYFPRILLVNYKKVNENIDSNGFLVSMSFFVCDQKLL